MNAMVKPKLTGRQQDVMNYIVEYWLENGTSPTYREIKERFSFKSVSTAQDHCAALARKSRLELSYRGVIPAGLKDHIREFFAEPLSCDSSDLTSLISRKPS